MANAKSRNSKRKQRKSKEMTKEEEEKYNIIIDKISDILETANLLEYWEYVHLSVGVSGVPVTLAHLIKTTPDAHTVDITRGE